MARIATWCVLGACTGLAACLTSGGGGSSGPVTFDPVANVLDGVPPFEASLGVAVPLMTSDRNGVSAIDGEITFNPDGTFTLDLPNGSSITVADADETDPPQPDTVLDTTVASYVVGMATQVDVHLGEDGVGRDLFFLGRVDDITGGSPGFLTWVLLGDETDTLPTGSATFNGGFYADILDVATGAYVAERTGDSVINADFDAVTDHIGITLTVTGAEGGGEEYSGTGTIGSGARYTGTIASSGGMSAFSGDFNGAFFGAGAEATAGTFNAVDTGAGTELVGGFSGFQ